MPHICADEILMIMMMIPFIGYFFNKIHVWYHEKINHKCHTEGCNETHAEHKEDGHGI
jgi:hypothetical protein